MLAFTDICLTYHGSPIIDNVSLSFGRSEVVGVVGPNGAGKTSLLNAICGCGNVSGVRRLNGRELKRGVSADLSYVAAEPVVIEEFTAIEFMRFDAVARGLTCVKSEAEQLLAQFGCAGYADRPLNACSLGMRKRVVLASAWQGAPKVILLDEPLNGLDTEAILVLKQAIGAVRERGGIVLVSAHVLSFIEETCDRVLMLDGGAVIRDMPLHARNLEELFCSVYGSPEF